MINLNLESNRFLSSPKDLLEVSAELAHLYEVSNQHPVEATQRAKSVEKLHEICNEASTMAQTDLVIAQKDLVDKLGKDGMSVYRKYFEDPPQTLEDFGRRIKKVVVEADTVLAPPIRKAIRGHNGPTLLVSYPEVDEERGLSNYNTSVIKWTTVSEILSHRVYDLVCRLMNNSEFKVAESTSYDFEKKVSYSVDGKRSVLDETLNTGLKTTFKKIKRLCRPEADLKDKKIVIFENIKGQNIFDFVLTKYRYLDKEQKNALFKRFAMIGLLDMVLGNNDRFISVFEDFEVDGMPYVLDEQEANLGNVMIEWDVGSTDPILYAIDNGIEPDFYKNSRLKKKYNAFLRKTLSRPGVIDTLAANMVTKIKKDINTHVLLWSDEIENAADKVSPFIEDLDSMAISNFKEGLLEMADRMKEEIIPKLQENISSSSGDYQEHFPKFFSALGQRMEIFTSNYQSQGATV